MSADGILELAGDIDPAAGDDIDDTAEVCAGDGGAAAAIGVMLDTGAGVGVTGGGGGG